MEIRLPEDGVIKILSKDVFTSEQIWSILSDVLTKKDCVFAAFSTFPGMYVWTLPGRGWTSLSETDESTAMMVRDVLKAKRRAVTRALTPWPTLKIEALFTVPSDEYVFFRDGHDGQIQIMLAAWDYKRLEKQEGMEGKVKGTKSAKRQDVILQFIEADEPVPGYGLRLQLADGSWTDKETDISGCFSMPGLEVGRPIRIKSSDGVRDFSFIVEEGRSLIVHDLTGPVMVEVEVTRDGAAASGLPVIVTHADHDFEVVTGVDGVARLTVPYRRDTQVTASVEGKETTVPAEYPLTRLSIALFTKPSTVIVEYFRGSDPVNGQEVLVRVRGMDDVVLHTDSSGRASCRVPFREGAYAIASSGRFVDKKILQEETIFRFVEEVPVVVPEPEPEPIPDPDDPVPHSGDVQILLEWETSDDVDLHVIDPAGEEIYYSHRHSASGGELDIDANVSTIMRHPKENVYWPSGGAPSGRYKVRVVLYYKRTRRPIRYRVTVKNGERVDHYTGVLVTTGQCNRVCKFTYRRDGNH